jgi:hypothetical protein
MSETQDDNWKLAKKTLRWTIAGVVVAALLWLAGYMWGTASGQSNRIATCRETLIRYVGQVTYYAAIKQDAATSSSDIARAVADTNEMFNFTLSSCPIRWESNSYIPEAQRSGFYFGREQFECATQMRPPEKCGNITASIADANRTFQAALGDVIRTTEKRQNESIIQKIQHVFDQDV